VQHGRSPLPDDAPGVVCVLPMQLGDLHVDGLNEY
jgi:hypothetical protein